MPKSKRFELRCTDNFIKNLDIITTVLKTSRAVAVELSVMYYAENIIPVDLKKKLAEVTEYYAGKLEQEKTSVIYSVGQDEKKGATK